MEVSNKLLLSLKQDLRFLNRISEEIIEKVSYFKLNSWLYPGKSYTEVIEKSLTNKSKEKQYYHCLELMIDRLYLIINLIIKYTENFPNITRERKNVVRPNNLSLGASTDLLWKKLLDLNELIVVRQKNTLKETSLNFNKTTQTITSSSNICDSCATAISCMKEILNQMEINIEAIFVRKIRKSLHEDIYDITQNGCMNRITSAILKDGNIFLERLQNREKQNKELNAKLKEIRIKYGESINVIKNLERFLDKMKKRSRNVKIKNKSLLKKLQEVVSINRDTECKLIEERNKTKILKKSIQEKSITIKFLSKDKESLEKKLEETLTEKLNFSHEKNLWKNKFSEMYLENRDLKNKLEELETMGQIGKNCEKISKNLEEKSLEMLEKTETFEKILKSLTDKPRPKKITDIDRVVLFEKKSFQITGDPIVDMKKQVEVNMFNIKTLERHNNDLLQIIHRVQEKIVPVKLV